MSVIIGVDPHKASHTAVAIGGDEREVAKVTVRATCQQTPKLLAWAEPFAERTWAIESAGGLGYLLAQQLVDAGEVVQFHAVVRADGREGSPPPVDADLLAKACVRGVRAVEVEVAHARGAARWGIQVDVQVLDRDGPSSRVPSYVAKYATKEPAMHPDSSIGSAPHPT